MFWKKKEGLQGLNLGGISAVAQPERTSPAPVPSVTLPDPARAEAVARKAKEILDSGRIPERLFVCTTKGGLLLYGPGGNMKPAMLLFSNPFVAVDYLRATNTAGVTGHFPVESLPELARTWLAAGVQRVAFDRCPRCPEFITFDLAAMASGGRDAFAKIWATHRAARIVLAQLRIQSAMKHSAAGEQAAARNDLEYVRDHFDYGVPYLHQLIGLIGGLQHDEPAKALAIERLKEFGSQFEGPLEFSPEAYATAIVGLMTAFELGPANGVGAA